MIDGMVSRRALLAAGASAAALSSAVQAFAAQAAPKPASQADAALDAILTRHFNENVDESPELATNLGFDKGPRAALKYKLGDRSQAEAVRDRQKAQARWAEIQKVDRTKLTPAGQLNYDIAAFRAQGAAEASARFAYGSVGGRVVPYVLSQLSGSYYSVPDFLDSQHKIETKDDADAYLSRLNAFPTALDQDTERFKHDVGLGVVPPDYVMAMTIANLKKLRDTPARETTLVASLARRAGEKNLGGDYAAAAQKVVEGPVREALNRQIAALEAVQPRAVHDAGVWRLPDGEALYRAGILGNTTTDMTGEQVHQEGLRQVAELQGQLEGLLRQAGYTQGTIGARLDALNRDPKQLYPNTDAGRAELLAELNRQIDDVNKRLPRVFNHMPKAALEIRRVPVSIEQGAPGGYYNGAPLDGSRPGVYYINLKDTAEWPKFALPTLSFHEGNPGHHFQISLSREAGEIPIYRRLGGFSAYSEGWALYAERVADELGVYENDVLGRIGYLQSYMFRAVRLVVDSGIHHKRWSREQAIKYMMDTAGSPEGKAVREIERYTVWPGQACAYKLGQTVIDRLRNDSEKKLGAKFDIKAFHDTVLLSGAVPLTVLQRIVGEWQTTVA